ncbi:MAG: hypothetical protein JW776_10370 [Candidatus Lokiarchaeota archaeon]|nr:hypothetical protein [Candidatus Lokiarchaeota archaeon]
MAKLDLGPLGIVEIGRRSFKANLNISSEALFGKYSNLTSDLSTDSVNIIRDSIDKGTEERIRGSTSSEISDYFEKIKSLQGKLGFGADERKEYAEAQDYKRKQMDSGKMAYESDEIQTIDRDSGKKEGVIKLTPGKKEGKLVPVKILENSKIYLEHDGTDAAEESVTSGMFSIENVSTKDRLWDIDLSLKNIDSTDFEEEAISIYELAPGEKEEKTYEVKEKAARHIDVSEFISTLNDPDTESYSLVLDADNEIYYSIIVTNITDVKLENIEVTKLIPDLFERAKVLRSSSGKADEGNFDEGRGVKWVLEELKPNAEEKLELKLEVKVKDKDTKVRSGKIFVKYNAPITLSGLGIDKFDAYTNNSFYEGFYETDERPDKYECQFVFENKSEYLLRLVNADVYDVKNPSVKYVDIDPGEVPPLPEGAKWKSNIWEYQSEPGQEPVFMTKVQFFVIADHMVSTEGLMEINDVELAVASIAGELSYDEKELASFRESTFHVNMKVENTGGADLNEVILTENIQDGFRPPETSDVVVTYNGDEIEVDTIIVNRDGVTVELKDLKEKPLGAFKPGDIIQVTYPIVADKPNKTVIYTSDVLYQANTYPAGKALEVRPAVIEIPVIHVRKRLIRGKEIIGLAATGEYEIILYVVNTGDYVLRNFEVADKVPENFEYSGLSLEPVEVTKKEGLDVLKWKIEKIESGDRFEIKYKLSGTGKPSDAQESM